MSHIVTVLMHLDVENEFEGADAINESLRDDTRIFGGKTALVDYRFEPLPIMSKPGPTTARVEMYLDVTDDAATAPDRAVAAVVSPLLQGQDNPESCITGYRLLTNRPAIPYSIDYEEDDAWDFETYESQLRTYLRGVSIHPNYSMTAFKEGKLTPEQAARAWRP